MIYCYSSELFTYILLSVIIAIVITAMVKTSMIIIYCHGHDCGYISTTRDNWNQKLGSQLLNYLDAAFKRREGKAGCWS